MDSIPNINLLSALHKAIKPLSNVDTRFCCRLGCDYPLTYAILLSIEMQYEPLVIRCPHAILLSDAVTVDSTRQFVFVRLGSLNQIASYHDGRWQSIQRRSGEKQKSLSLNGCNFFVRNPLMSSSTALESAAPETFKNGVSFCLTPPELGDRVG